MTFSSFEQVSCSELDGIYCGARTYRCRTGLQGYQFATRSFIDEFYNLFLKDASSLPFKVEITNVPEDIQAMITSVSKTQTKVKTIRPTSNVLNFENVDDLLKYMSTVAF